MDAIHKNVDLELETGFDQSEELKRQVMIKRFIVNIVLLIKENPVLPFSFNFGGKCILESLKKER